MAIGQQFLLRTLGRANTDVPSASSLLQSRVVTPNQIARLALKDAQAQQAQVFQDGLRLSQVISQNRRADQQTQQSSALNRLKIANERRKLLDPDGTVSSRARRVGSSKAGGSGFGGGGDDQLSIFGDFSGIGPVDPDVFADVTADSLAAHLGEGLKPFAKDFVEAGKETGIDPRFLAAISKFETGNGTSEAFLQKKNAMGISDSSGPVALGSVRDSIFTQARKMARQNGPYGGLATIGQIGAVYAPPGENDVRGTNNLWPSSVGKFYTEMGGDASGPIRAVPRAGRLGAGQEGFRVIGDFTTAAQAAQLRSQGGMMVRMDSNWAPKKGTLKEVMFVVPDDLPAEDIAKAQRSADRLAALYNETYGTNEKRGVVRTRSQNKRGIRNGIHAELATVDDVDFWAMIQRNPDRFAQAMSDGIGQIPGVVFSMPHGDRNADGSRRAGAEGLAGSEESIARNIMLPALANYSQRSRQQHTTPTFESLPLSLFDDPGLASNEDLDSQLAAMRPRLQYFSRSQQAKDLDAGLEHFKALQEEKLRRRKVAQERERALEKARLEQDERRREKIDDLTDSLFELYSDPVKNAPMIRRRQAQIAQLMAPGGEGDSDKPSKVTLPDGTMAEISPGGQPLVGPGQDGDAANAENLEVESEISLGPSKTLSIRPSLRIDQEASRRFQEGAQKARALFGRN